MNICLFAAASDDLHPDYLAGAEAFGREAGRRGHTLIFGGGATGLMGAAARGMTAAGGKLVGVAPWFFQEEGVLYPRCDEMIYTDTMGERKQILLERAEGFAVLPGGIGTFDEFFEVLTLRQLGKCDKPIALLNLRGYFDPLLALLKNGAEQGFFPEKNMALWAAFCRPESLLDRLEREARGE